MAGAQPQVLYGVCTVMTLGQVVSRFTALSPISLNQTDSKYSEEHFYSV